MKYQMAFKNGNSGVIDLDKFRFEGSVMICYLKDKTVMVVNINEMIYFQYCSNQA